MVMRPAWRTSMIAIVLAVSSSWGAGPAKSQAFPSKAITIVVAFPAGGFADSFARLIGNQLSERQGWTVVIDNRPGAGGNLGAAAAARATADGHTLLVTTNALVINEALTRDRGFAIDDLKAAAIPAWAPEVLIVNSKHPARTLTEFIAGAKGRSINFGTPGRGTVAHIVTSYLFKQLPDIEAVHVPFQGGAPVVNALMGGHIDLAGGAAVGYAAQLQSGAFRAIAIAAEQRLPRFPDVPTYVESGFPGLVITNWVGVFVPGKTAETITIRLNEAIDAAIREPAVQARLKSLEMEPRHGDQAGAQAYFKEELVKWTRMVQAIGIAEK
jgi:tripartite-type tricarboxylate transporter receptor subunit TctC